MMNKIPSVAVHEIYKKNNASIAIWQRVIKNQSDMKETITV